VKSSQIRFKQRKRRCNRRSRPAGDRYPGTDAPGQPRREHTAQRGVIEQEYTKQHGQQIEKIEVAGEHDQELEYQDTPGGNGPQASRRKDEKYDADFDD
jgi:hypothetical protein